MNLPKSIQAWVAPSRGAKLERQELPMPALGEHDVAIEVRACGICHSDLHLIQDDWGFTSFPLIPGHEIVGQIVARGAKVALPLGTTVGVGWQRSACLECHDCLTSRENMCDHNQATCVGHPGGFADYHVTDSRFAFPIPKQAASSAASLAPLFCGGATVFSPLTELINPADRPGARVGIVALGGLGHLAVKLANKLGYEVTLFSSTPSKEAEARKMGAHHFVTSHGPEEIEALGRRLDMVLVTANVDLPWTSYLKALRADGTLCFVGIPPKALTLRADELLNKRLRVAASPIASRARISQMLELCAREGIGAEIERFPMEQANEALARVKKNDVRYRAVLVRD